MNINTKTPISYYGGKQNMLRHILPLIPAHKLYCEPFFGGGAVYFAKQPSQIEVINDRNDFVINFYRVLKLRFDELKAEVEASLSSRSIHRKAGYIMRNPAGYDEVKLAWAFWYLANFSFGSSLDSAWKTDLKENRVVIYMRNKKETMSQEAVLRLEMTQIENKDALYCINKFDQPESFFYEDPPYIDANQQHYRGYTIDQYQALLDCNEKLTGRFLLSCFDTDIIRDYAAKNRWLIITKEMANYAPMARAAMGDTRPRKVELLVMNYEPAGRSQLTCL
ncbi:MAG: DNA adenine methylase [Mucilaginibacter sp.]